MRRVMAVALLALAVGGCDVLFPTAVDPCPLPPEKHPEAWTEIPMYDAGGSIIAYTYVCASQ